MPKLVCHAESVEPKSVDLRLGVTRIGRGGDNDWIIPDSSISGHHCEFVWIDNVIRIRDLDSTNGTFVDGQSVGESVVQSSSRIQLGDICFSLANDETVVSIPTRAAETRPESVALPDGKLSCRAHQDEAAVWECTKCEALLCWACVRRLRVAGRQPLTFCGLCDARCRPASQSAKKQSAWKRWFSGLARHLNRRSD